MGSFTHLYLDITSLLTFLHVQLKERKGLAFNGDDAESQAEAGLSADVAQTWARTPFSSVSPGQSHEVHTLRHSQLIILSPQHQQTQL